MAGKTQISRRIVPQLKEDLTKKMVFLAGPRQCGKTTLAREILEKGGSYYSWDIASQRKALLEERLDPNSRLWVFDEIHKNRRWRNWLKGIYDEHHERHSILVTGSAKLDLYSRGGDSLQGRYYLHRLHPLTFSEISGFEIGDAKKWMELERQPQKNGTNLLLELLALGGFPEPFLSSSEREAARWRLSYGTRLVREEVRSLETILDLDRMEILYERLAETIGSVLSINSLREDLEVAFKTAKNWIAVFERLYGVFRIFPFGPAKIKAVKKEGKLYFWDWSRALNPAARFENLIAVHLLRLCHWMEDVEGKKCELRFFRTEVGHEVDFVILLQNQPWFAVEVKLDDRPLDRNLSYLLERVRIPFAFQVSLNGNNDYKAPSIGNSQIRITSGARFLAGLP